MSNYTWNIMFIAVDTEFDVNLNKNPSNDAVSDAIKKFEQEVCESNFTNPININSLIYQNTGNNGSVVLKTLDAYKNLVALNTTEIEKLYVDQKFDCLDSNSYKIFIEKHFKKEADQKNMIIFLAHSFGAGYFCFEETIDGVKQATKYFTTIQLNKAILDAIGKADPIPLVINIHEENLNQSTNTIIDKKIDCLFGFNCSLQSIETNFIFRDTVELLLASQQTLHPKNIFFKDMLVDMVNFSKLPNTAMSLNLSDEHLFSKFIFDCNRMATARYTDNLEPFGLSLTKPIIAIKIYTLLNLFANELYKLENYLFLIAPAKRFCEDPSTDNQISILDAKQFFTKLKEVEYQSQFSKELNEILELILTNINQLIIATLTTGNSIDKLDVWHSQKFGKIKIYIPCGVGLFMPKTKNNTVKEILKIYNILQNQASENNDDFNIATSWGMMRDELSNTFSEKYTIKINRYKR